MECSESQASEALISRLGPFVAFTVSSGRKLHVNSPR